MKSSKKEFTFAESDSISGSHLNITINYIQLTYSRDLRQRELKLDGAIVDFADPSEGGKLVILLHNTT